MTRRDRYRLVNGYARGERRHLVVLSLLGAAPALVAALQPLPLKLLADNALGDQPLSGMPAQVLANLGLSESRRSLVLVAAVLTTVAALGSYLVSNLIGLYWEQVGARMVRTVSADVFGHLQELSLGYHQQHATGDSLSRVTTDASAVYSVTNVVLVTPITSIVLLVAVGWSAWRLSPSLTLLSLGIAPVLGFTSWWSNRLLKRRAAEARRDQVAVVSFVTQVIQSLPIVQAFTAEPANLRTFRSIADRSRSASERSAVAESAAEATAVVISAIGAAVVLVVGGRAVLRGTLTVGDLLVFMAYLRSLSGQFRTVLGVGRQLRLAEVGLDRIAEVLASDGRLPEPTEPVPLPPARRAGTSVVWRDVVFGYEPDRPVLHMASMVVEPGEVVAIVGRSGAGKSTLLSLVPRFFDPWSGSVLLDGVNVRDAGLDEVRRRVALVRQSPLILPVSVRENIALGRPGASRADIEWAAGEALAAEFIEALPDGYETVMAEDGSTLSGGQRQRLAIARAFLKDAPILIMDEPTSALDADSERGLLMAVRRLAADRTVLVIAHRLSTVEQATRTIVMEDGWIVESGDHEQLLRNGGTYARFHELQTVGRPR